MNDARWQCLLAVRWLPPEQRGRRSGPPPGPGYAATAVFVLGGDADVTPGWPAAGEHFSVVLELLGPPSESGQAKARFVAPDLANAYLSEGAEMLIMEGPRPVARALVLSVDDDQLLD